MMSVPKSLSRAITTVNSPLPIHIDIDSLARCLRLEETDIRWKPHMRAFFDEVHVNTYMDMVIEGSITFDDLYRCMMYWDLGDSENAAWIREMTPDLDHSANISPMIATSDKEA